MWKRLGLVLALVVLMPEASLWARFGSWPEPPEHVGTLPEAMLSRYLEGLKAA